MFARCKEIRVILMTLLGIIILLTWYFFVYSPLLTQETKVKNEITGITSELSSLNSQLSSIGNISLELKSIKLKWTKFAQQLVIPDSVEQLAVYFHSLANEGKISILDMDLDFAPLIDKVNTDLQIRPIDKIKMNIEGRGRYLAIGKFIETLENDLLVSSIKKVELKYQQAANPEIYFKMSMEIFLLMENKELL